MDFPNPLARPQVRIHSFCFVDPPLRELPDNPQGISSNVYISCFYCQKISGCC